MSRNFFPNDFKMVRGRGLEPPRVTPPEPKSGASANSAILATVPSSCDKAAAPASHRNERPPRPYSPDMDTAARITFSNSRGAELSARLHLPPTTPRAYALFAHCFTCGKDIRAAVEIAKALAEHDIATLRFDFTGLGRSEGEFAETTFSSDVADIVAAAAYLRDTYDAPAILIGHSLGGAAILAAAADIPESRAVVTIGAPFDPAHVLDMIDEDARAEIDEAGAAAVSLAGRAFEIRREFVHDLLAQDPSERIGALGRALLVLHSPQDNVVGIDHARQIYQAARHPKSFVTLDGAEHLLSDKDDARYAASLLATWVERYLPAREIAPHHHDEVLVEGGARGFRQRVVVGEHVFYADEPESVGGTDSGPTPYDLLLAGLGACTSMTLRMYADRKGWDLRGVEVRLSHRRDHVKDAEGATSRIETIDKHIRLEGGLDGDQRERLYEIAERCPVNRTLLGELRIVPHHVD